MGSPPTNHSSSHKTRLNDLSYGVQIWTDLSSVLSQITRLTDRQTDGRTDRTLIAEPRLLSIKRGKNHKSYTQLLRIFAPLCKMYFNFSRRRGQLTRFERELINSESAAAAAAGIGYRSQRNIIRAGWAGSTTDSRNNSTLNLLSFLFSLIISACSSVRNRRCTIILVDGRF